jgi:hypothetical protein
LVHSFRGFFPFSVSQPRGATARPEGLAPPETHLGGSVASSGFHTLATPCSPHGLPGLFHPGSAHGVLPFEALLLAWCCPSSQTSRPSGFLLNSVEKRPPFKGLAHQTKHLRRSGYQPGSCGECLLGLSRFEASCPRQRGTLFGRPFIPSRAFSDRPHADRTAGASGSFCRGRSRSLSRPASLLAVSHLVSFSLR